MTQEETESIIKKIAYNEVVIELLKAQIEGTIIPEIVYDIISELKAKL